MIFIIIIQLACHNNDISKDGQNLSQNCITNNAFDCSFRDAGTKNAILLFIFRNIFGLIHSQRFADCVGT